MSSACSAFSAVALPLPSKGRGRGGVSNYFADRILATPPQPPPLQWEGKGCANTGGEGLRQHGRREGLRQHQV